MKPKKNVADLSQLFLPLKCVHKDFGQKYSTYFNHKNEKKSKMSSKM